MIDLTKKYKTRSGCEVQNLHRSRGKAHPYQIAGTIVNGDLLIRDEWTESGKYATFCETHEFDLVEVIEPTPEPKQDWPQFDPTKQYTTRSGKPFRYYASDGGGPFPIHGATWEEGRGRWIPRKWTTSGKYEAGSEESDLDLIEVKPRIKREIWLNVYERLITVYETREHADISRGVVETPRLACIKIPIDCEHGEGL